MEFVILLTGLLATLLFQSGSTDTVVHIDFSKTISHLDPSALAQFDVVPLKVVDEDLLCTRSNFLGHLVADRPDYSYFVEQRLRRFLLHHRLKWASRICYTYTLKYSKVSYELCLAQHINYTVEGDITKLRRAHYTHSEDRQYPNGTIVSKYEDFAHNTTFQVIMTCALYIAPTIADIEEISESFYRLTFTAQAFCDWPNDPQLNLGLLMGSTEQWCSNFTDQRNQTYEFCYPDSLYRFSSGPNNTAHDLKLLGYLSFYGYSAFESLYDEHFIPVQSDLPYLRSKHMRLIQPGRRLRWTKLDYFISTDPFYTRFATQYRAHPYLTVLNYPIPVLVIPMQPGHVCSLDHKTPKHYRVQMIFHCTVRADVNALPKILEIQEVATCEYHLHIASPHLCMHPVFLPRAANAHLKTSLCVKNGLRSSSNLNLTNAALQVSSLPSTEALPLQCPTQPPSFPIPQSDVAYSKHQSFACGDIVRILPFNAVGIVMHHEDELAAEDLALVVQQVHFELKKNTFGFCECGH